MLGLCLGLLLLPTQTPKAGGPLLSSRVELGEIPPKVVYLQAETLSRGPVHEAYAAAGANLNFSGKHEVKTQPPAPLLEVPPGLPPAPAKSGFQVIGNTMQKKMAGSGSPDAGVNHP